MMADDVLIDRATLADLDAILAVERVCFPTPWTREAFARELAREDDVALYVAARDGDEVVGYAGMWVLPVEAHLCTIAVAPMWQRRGLGTRILLHMLQEAVWRGAGRLVLEYRVSNLAAHSMYVKYGFRLLGVRKNYYRDGLTREDAIVASLDDIQAPGFASQLDAWKQEIDT
ncbi:MAG: ribosomal protein S18-alanine N-acetyltransferase [Armatimonadota bacterium]|jgi:ribosomal-protein-alanine N-acetyltransferase